MYGGDVSAVEAALGSLPKVRSRIIPLLIREKRYDEAIKMWNSLDASNDKLSYQELAKTLEGQFLEAKRFRDAAKVIADVSDDTSRGFMPSKLANGDFEDRNDDAINTIFRWRIADGNAPRVGLVEGKKRSGSLSMFIGFGNESTAFRSIGQSVPVVPGKNYTFEIYYISEMSPAVLRWEIIDLVDNKRLAVTEPLVVSTDWKMASAEFDVPETSDGVEVRLIVDCPQPGCEPSGSIWFDDAAIRERSK
jgi:hypothetical protein